MNATFLILGLLTPTAEVTPQAVAAALPELEKYVERMRDKAAVPGVAVVVVHQDRVAYLKGFGVRQVGKDEPVDADTVFQLASMSKPITTTVLAALVGEGAVGWDDRVIDRDPAFRLADPWVTREVTLRDLLCHRSGLADHAGDLLEDLGYDRAEVLRRLRFANPASSFRSRFAYTNFGFTAAAVAAARAAGKPWEDVASEKLYRPLGMAATSSRFADYAAAKNRAVGHVRVDGKPVAKYVRDADAQSPAGGVSSTANDVGRWLRLLLAGGKFDGKQVVAAAALAETFRPQIASGPPEHPATERTGLYGLGWNVSYDDRGRVRLNHSGGFDLGAATVVTLLPAEGLGIAVLTNAAPVGVPEAIAASFFDLALNGKLEADWAERYRKGFEAVNAPPYGTATDYRKPPERPTPPLPDAAYVGTYDNAYFGPVEVAAEQGRLVLRTGPKRTAFPLRHWGRDVFLYQPAGEMAAGLGAVTFTVGPAGNATRVVLEDLDVHGQGAFTRGTAGK